MIEIKSVDEILNMSLAIPDYQRPYRWTTGNINDLLSDVEIALAESQKYPNFKYRIGTIILHTHRDSGRFDIVDGQQRILSLILIKRCLNVSFQCGLSDTKFENAISIANIRTNYSFIVDWFSLKSEDFKNRVEESFSNILEVVVVGVDKLTEAFQLFDSQNTRGKTLDPHDLLKAYHLRAMRNHPYEMRRAVQKWETVNSKQIKELFSVYLFPIRQWAKKEKNVPFGEKQIDVYKGISADSPYTYAKRGE